MSSWGDKFDAWWDKQDEKRRALHENLKKKISRLQDKIRPERSSQNPYEDLSQLLVPGKKPSLPRVRALIDQLGGDINRDGTYGLLLRQALEAGQEEAAAELVHYGKADMGARMRHPHINHNDDLPLPFYLMNRDCLGNGLAGLECLLKLGLNPNFDDGTNTLLRMAVGSRGSLEFVRLLGNYDAAPNYALKGDVHRLPIQETLFSEHFPQFQALLHMGADIRLPSTPFQNTARSVEKVIDDIPELGQHRDHILALRKEWAQRRDRARASEKLTTAELLESRKHKEGNKLTPKAMEYMAVGCLGEMVNPALWANPLRDLPLFIAALPVHWTREPALYFAQAALEGLETTTHSPLARWQERCGNHASRQHDLS